MPIKRELSEAAQLFLRDFQKILSDLAKETGFEIVALDRKGELISEFQGIQKVCQLIQRNSQGKLFCQSAFFVVFSILEKTRTPVFARCHLNYNLVGVPIIFGNALLGAIIICGKKAVETLSKEKYLKFANEIFIESKEEFLKAIQDVAAVQEDEIKKTVDKVKKLLEILKEMSLTPLKELFG